MKKPILKRIFTRCQAILLVGVRTDGNEFEMDWLLQFSTRKWLEEWKEMYVTLMDDSYPVGELDGVSSTISIHLSSSRMLAN